MVVNQVFLALPYLSRKKNGNPQRKNSNLVPLLFEWKVEVSTDYGLDHDLNFSLCLIGIL